MARLAHGSVPNTEDLTKARSALAEASADIPLAFAIAPPVDLHDFDFMFPTLQDERGQPAARPAPRPSNS